MATGRVPTAESPFTPPSITKSIHTTPKTNASRSCAIPPPTICSRTNFTTLLGKTCFNAIFAVSFVSVYNSLPFSTSCKHLSAAGCAYTRNKAGPEWTHYQRYHNKDMCPRLPPEVVLRCGFGCFVSVLLLCWLVTFQGPKNDEKHVYVTGTPRLCR